MAPLLLYVLFLVGDSMVTKHPGEHPRQRTLELKELGKILPGRSQESEIPRLSGVVPENGHKSVKQPTKKLKESSQYGVGIKWS